MRACILFLMILGFSLISYAQSILPDKVRVQLDDQNIVASIKPLKSEVQAVSEKYYHWYSGGKLQVTQGGFSGKLLNGTYESFYLNKSIREQGVFKKGLKTGTWKSWYEGGNLKDVTEWKLGNKNGEFSEYQDNGKIQRMGKYRGGLLHGKLRSYSGKDSLLVQEYRKGELVVKKARKENGSTKFFKKLKAGTKKLGNRIFKKKSVKAKKTKV